MAERRDVRAELTQGVQLVDGAGTLRADRIVIATGCVRESDAAGLTSLEELPATLTIPGATVGGIELASAAAALGIGVTVIVGRERILEFVDPDLVEALQYHLRGLGVVFRSGERIGAGRRGATEGLALDAAGLEAGPDGCLRVDVRFRTRQPHILAAGGVTGAPGVATIAMHQGRTAALGTRPSALVPHAVHTVPELAFVGPREAELTAAGVPYVVGTARYNELPCSALSGDPTGMLKLLVHAETRRLLGVHLFGRTAGELVHIGHAAIAGGLSAESLADTLFGAPALSDAYRLAALDAAA